MGAHDPRCPQSLRRLQGHVVTPLDRILDGLEAAWIAVCVVDPDTRPDDLRYTMFKIGQFIEQHRPGLVDRLLDGIDDADGEAT